MISPPDWLDHTLALRIWRKTVIQLSKRGLLESTDPEVLAAYCYCLAQSIVYAQYDPEQVSWAGSDWPEDLARPAWLGLPGPGENHLACLWRAGAAYAANRLGLWPPVAIDFMELLVLDVWTELDGHANYQQAGGVTQYLRPEWEIKVD